MKKALTKFWRFITIIILGAGIVGLIIDPRLLVYVVSFFSAYICYRIAQDQNKEKGWALIYGLTYGLFAVVYYLVDKYTK